VKVWRLKILPLLWLSTQHLGQTTMVVTATPIISLLIEAEVGAITIEVEEEALHLINFHSIQSRF